MNNSIVSQYISFARICIRNYLKKILGKHYKQEEADKLIQVYVNARYYNQYQNIGLDFSAYIMKWISSVGTAMNLKDKSPSMPHLINSFKYILYFDNVLECESVNDKIKEIEEFRTNTLKLSKSTKFASDLFEMVKEDLFKKKEFIEEYYSDNFSSDYYLTNLNGVYDSILEQNIKFPYVYSELAISKIFNSRELEQRKIFVEYSFTSIRILQDILKGIFHNKYLVNFSIGILKKKTVSKKLFDLINNDLVKERMVFKIEYSEFNSNKELIYSQMRQGYSFAVILDSSFDDSDTNLKLLSVFKYIVTSEQVVSKKLSKYKNVVYIK